MELHGKLVFDDKIVSYAVKGSHIEVENLSNTQLTDSDLETVQNHILEIHNVHTRTAKEVCNGMV